MTSHIEHQVQVIKENIRYLEMLKKQSRFIEEQKYFDQLLNYQIGLLNEYILMRNSYQDKRQVQVLTLEELAMFNGKNGKPAYIAVNGKVYDVSLEKTWGGSSHFGLKAGKDVTEGFMKCHGNMKYLEQLPVVGILKEKRHVNE